MDNRQRGIGSIPVRRLQSGGGASWMDDAAFQDVVSRNDQQANRDASRRNAAIAFEANLGNVDALFQPKYGSGQLAPVDLGFGARLGPGAGGVNPGGVTPDEQKRSETASGVAQQNSMLGNALLSDMRLPASQRTAQIVVEDKSDPANPTFKPIFVTPKTAEFFNNMEPTKGDNQRASFIYNQLNTIGAGGAKNFNLNDPSGYVAAAARGPTPIAPTTSPLTTSPLTTSPPTTSPPTTSPPTTSPLTTSPPVPSTSTLSSRQQEIRNNLNGIFSRVPQSPRFAASNLQQYMAMMGLKSNDLIDLGYDPGVFVPLLQPLSSFSFAAGGAVDASDDPMVLYAQRVSRPGVGSSELDVAAHEANLLRDYNQIHAAYTPEGRQLEFTGKYQTSGDPIFSEDGRVPANMPSVSKRPDYRNALSTQQLFDLLALVSGDVPQRSPVQRFFTGGAVDPAATVRDSYAGAQNLYNMASQRFGADDPRTQSALANMRASQAQMEETLAALAKPSYTQPVTPPPAPVTPPTPITPPTPTYAQSTPTPEPGGIYPAVMLPYIDPRTGAVTQVNAGGTPPAGMIGATNPNIYGGQQNEFIGERGLFAKGSAADLRPIMNTVLAGQNPSVGAVQVDQNIGDVRLAGKSTDYKYSQAGNQLRVFDKNNNLVSSIAVQGDQDGTKLTFDDGSTFAKGVKNAAGSYEGGLQVGGVAAGAFKGLPPPSPPPGNDGLPRPIPPEVTIPDAPLPLPVTLPPPIPPYEEGKPDPRIVLGDIASRNVVDTRIPRADTVFANSPVERTFDPVSQTFRYPSSPTKVTPASGEFMSQFIPGNVTLRRPQLLNVTRGDVPLYDQKTGTYTAPALSASQYNAKMREQSLNAMNRVLSGKTYTTAEYYALLAQMRNGAFGDPTDPNFEKNMREAVDRYVAARAAAAPPPAPKTETITGGGGNDTLP